MCSAVIIPPRPVPNLGYACLNSTLQLQKPPVTTNRGAILRTFEEKGLPHISQLALQNCRDLLPIIQWNHEHNIRLFRYAQPSVNKVSEHNFCLLSLLILLILVYAADRCLLL